jgi:hypothetical protein
MQQVPQTILNAALFTLYRALVHCRNLTLSPKEDRRQEVDEIMEAIHDVPDFLANWQFHDLKELRLHLNCFDSTTCSGSPNLTKIFDMKLQEIEKWKHSLIRAWACWRGKSLLI